MSEGGERVVSERPFVPKWPRRFMVFFSSFSRLAGAVAGSDCLTTLPCEWIGICVQGQSKASGKKGV